MADFSLLEVSKLISRKIKVKEKSWKFYTVKMFLCITNSTHNMSHPCKIWAFLLDDTSQVVVGIYPFFQLQTCPLKKILNEYTSNIIIHLMIDRKENTVWKHKKVSLIRKYKCLWNQLISTYLLFFKKKIAFTNFVKIMSE